MAATYDEVIATVNTLIRIVNNIEKNSKNIPQLNTKTVLDGTEEIPISSGTQDFKILVSQLLGVYTGGRNISIINNAINTDLNSVFDGLILNKLAENPVWEEGKFWYNGNYNFYDAISGTSMQLCKEMNIDVYNKNGSDRGNFTVVRYQGSFQGLPSVERSIATSVENARSIGITTHNIAVDQPGKITTQGEAGGDTSMWNVDDVLYLSGTVAGELTNIEQPISAAKAIVLVADTEENGGKIYIYPSQVEDIIALGQSNGVNTTMSLSITPTKLEAYGSSNLEVNTTVTQTGSGPYTSNIKPGSVKARGYYRVEFGCSLTGSSNVIHTFEGYKNGSPTGLKTVVDLTNNNINAGSSNVSVITETPLESTDELEIYAFVNSGSSQADFNYVTFNIERIGNT